MRRGISAGRVQTVALRLIVEREREIQAFKPEEYWSIIARLEGHQPPPLEARHSKIKGKTAEVTNKEQADHILRTGQADLVMMAREFQRQPYWPLHAARRVKQDVRTPPQYLRAF